MFYRIASATVTRPRVADIAWRAGAGDRRSLVSATVEVAGDLAQSPFDEPRQALVPEGWTMSVWARIPKARLAAWTPDGALLVSLPASGQIVKLTPKPGAAPQESMLLEGLDQPHGMAFAGSTLYVAESDQIDTYDYANGAATNRRSDRRRASRRAQPRTARRLRACAEERRRRTRRCGLLLDRLDGQHLRATTATPIPRGRPIMRIPPGGGRAQPFATGVRNGTGLAVAPDGSVWTAVNNRDNAPDPDGNVDAEYVNEHPPEALARLTPGRELGWPYLQSRRRPGRSAVRPRHVHERGRVANGLRRRCRRSSRASALTRRRSGCAFTTGVLPQPYASGALVGVHGSWNRQPPRAPEVSFFPWRDGNLGDQQTLVGGFQADDGSRWGRPVAAVVGPDGAVYITDDYAGAVYRLAPPGR